MTQHQCPTCRGMDDESCDCETCNGRGWVNEQCFCKSYYNNQNELIDCTCGECK